MLQDLKVREKVGAKRVVVVAIMTREESRGKLNESARNTSL